MPPCWQVVRDGDKIRLEHRNTQKNLHSHAIPAPISPEFKEVMLAPSKLSQPVILHPS